MQYFWLVVFKNENNESNKCLEHKNQRAFWVTLDLNIFPRKNTSWKLVWSLLLRTSFLSIVL